MMEKDGWEMPLDRIYHKWGAFSGKSDKPEELKQFFVQVHDYGGGTTVRHVLEAALQYIFFPRGHK